MITDISLKNFKAFGSIQTARLSRITLVYGPNSAGKTSFLQSLLLLKQTIEDTEDPNNVLLPKGQFVDLGGFREFIHGHSIENTLSIRVSCAQNGELNPFPFSPQVKSLANLGKVGLECEISFDRELGVARLSRIGVHMGDGPDPAFTLRPRTIPDSKKHRRYFIFAIGNISKTGDQYFEIDSINKGHHFWPTYWKDIQSFIKQNVAPEISKRIETIERRVGRLSSKSIEVEGGKKPQQVELEEELQHLRQEYTKAESYSLSDSFEEFLSFARGAIVACRNFLPCAVHPLEDVSLRSRKGFWSYASQFGWLYERANLASMTVAVSNQLFRFLSEMIYIGPLRDYPERHYIYSGNLQEQVGKSGKQVADILYKRTELVDRVNREFQRFGLEYELKVSSVSDPESDLQDVFALRLHDKRTKVHSSILDVGFGISQVLPIIVQSMLSKKKTLLIKQPEIHLHPRLQADLASLIVSCTKGPEGNQFIVETHSQHLLLRIQKLIRNGELSTEDISILYVDKGDQGARILQLRMDRDGDFLDEWPDGFFEDGYREMFM